MLEPHDHAQANAQTLSSHPTSEWGSRLFAVYARWFARPSLIKWNYLLLHLGLRGLGILNYQTPVLSGERYFLQRILRGRTSPVVFDVGANVGDYASMVRECSPNARLICIEPHPKNLARLRTRQELRAEVVGCALGGRPGRLELFDYADNDGSSHASVYKEVIEEIHHGRSVSHPIEIITLDDFCAGKGIDHIDLLKIDTEGHEMAALSGAKHLLNQRGIDVIHFEFNEMNIISRVFLRDFRMLLKDYVFYRLLPNGWIRLKDDRLDEIFAFQNIVAIRNGHLRAT